MNTKLLSTIIILSISCTGCGALSTPLNVMTPPSLTTQQRDIKEDITSQLPLNSEIKQPFQSTSLPLYNLVDLTGDKVDEVVVFYSEIQKKTILSLGVFQQVNNEWINISKMDIPMHQGESLLFKDVTGDKVDDIILSYINERNEFSYTVLQLINNSLQETTHTREIDALLTNGGNEHE